MTRNSKFHHTFESEKIERISIKINSQYQCKTSLNILIIDQLLIIKTKKK